MTLDTILSTLAADIAAAERRTEEYGLTVRMALMTGRTDETAEHALYLELDRLALLRDRQYALRDMQRLPLAA
ncbi:hypothetical protein [Methylobacterium platani]|uniref:Uncharacterized protein n=2 Tax=Methylobacterium platani TaxID=427683 RepID=A0A179SG53_9HYPH|nr:hypothetical protein [Methylobacterium platani]KMO16662.1 hypothetical protein SQ03_14260 [Methylobacterium platani JCM 14648]OAS26575.1 hypothetical protein A5481_05885 [Methylobacterium platani]